MPMRIDDSNGAGQSSAIQRRLAELARGRSTRSDKADPSAEVEISPAARDLARASQIARSTPEVRAERVALLRAQVEAGTYRVSSQEIARRILEELGADAR
jgi:negative regulator of flagellin synthesis FlgM